MMYDRHYLYIDVEKVKAEMAELEAFIMKGGSPSVMTPIIYEYESLKSLLQMVDATKKYFNK